MPKYITISDIRDYPKDQPLIIPVGYQLTPAALDLARDKGFNIILETSDTESLKTTVIEALRKKGITDPKALEEAVNEVLSKLHKGCCP
ncbi:MAG: hypothetical protein DDT22_00602 [candidate division WS2 bacterium]|nr:hypothetical protein [Candidatus Lithacetigena glycinireducens]